MARLLRGAALFLGGALAGAAAVMLLPEEKKERIKKELSDIIDEAKKMYEGSKIENQQNHGTGDI
ncbi:MAG: hypothetical protein IJR74_04160 [Paludibacteraceae bacterium]|nr:hypothetical protein [Paludibacteraceae bacterium]